MTHFPITEDVLDVWGSPLHEASVAKDVPMWLLPDFQRENPGKYRYRYRGPSNPAYDRPQSHTIKKWARSFAIYPK